MNVAKKAELELEKPDEEKKTRLVVDFAVIHKLVKERQGKAATVLRDELLALTDPVAKLVDDIHDLYSSRTGKGYGRFEADETNYPSSRILRETCFDKKKTFLDASRDLMSVLAAKAGDEPLATGGYVLMAQGSTPGKTDWFIVALITNVHGSAIKDDSLDIVDAVHVDMHNLRVAGRVNLTDWVSQKADVRYIGFLKQRNEVSEYFKRFLGCNELIASTEETKKLVTFLKNFVKEAGLDQERQVAFLRAAYDHCEERRKNDQPLILDTLINVVWPDDPMRLQKALTTGDIQISDGFVPDGRSLKAFVTIRAKTPYWSLELKREALVKGQAKYDKDKGTLTFVNLPTQLETELQSELN